MCLFRGINEGYKDGLIAGKEEGLKEGFREGLKSGKDFGLKLAISLLPLLQILNQPTSSSCDPVLLDSARKLLAELGAISLANEEDPEKLGKLNQIEARIKALTVNFSKKVKNVSINRINNKSNKNELSF